MEMMVSFNNLKHYMNYLSCLTSASFKQSAKRSTIHNTLHFICIKYMILDFNSLGSKKIMVNKIKTCVCVDVWYQVSSLSCQNWNSDIMISWFEPDLMVSGSHGRRPVFREGNILLSGFFISKLAGGWPVSRELEECSNLLGSRLYFLYQKLVIFLKGNFCVFHFIFTVYMATDIIQWIVCNLIAQLQN